MKRILILLVACAMATCGTSGLALASGSSFRDDFGVFDESRWDRGDHQLGRSYLNPANVGVSGGNLNLKLPARSTDGAEIASDELYGYGSYTARIKVPRAPSSITGFFLYYPPDRASEVDIEIFNDRSRKVMFTSYKAGNKVTETMKLPFDPTRGFHNYRFDYAPGSLKFYVDGKLMHSYSGNVPDEPMRLYANAWYPNWLEGKRSGKNKFVKVDWIRHIQP